jgi:EEF1A N-terminal glycine/lysine methyltransferase
MYPLFTNEVLPQGRYRVRLGYGDEWRSLNVKTRSTKEFNDGLFADDIWPGSVLLSDFLCDNPTLCRDKCVAELGAGGALPSLVALSLGAKRSLITDFPGSGILENIQDLLQNNGLWLPDKVHVAGLKWGLETSLSGIGMADGVSDTDLNHLMAPSYDLIILAELLWKDTYPLHGDLLDTVARLMRPGGGTTVLCSFAHRPTETHAPARDLEFLQLAESRYGMKCEKIGSKWVPDASGGGAYEVCPRADGGAGVDPSIQEKLDAGLVEVFLFKLIHSASSL